MLKIPPIFFSDEFKELSKYIIGVAQFFLILILFVFTMLKIQKAKQDR